MLKSFFKSWKQGDYDIFHFWLLILEQYFAEKMQLNGKAGDDFSKVYSKYFPKEFLNMYIVHPTSHRTDIIQGVFVVIGQSYEK